MAAIYMWRGGVKVVLTTTLYPVEDVAEVDISIAISNQSAMRIVPQDNIEFINIAAINGTYEQVRWFFEYGPEDDAIEFNAVAALNGVYTQVRWFYEYGPVDDAIEFSSILPLDGTLIGVGVLGDSPDEELEVNLAISDSSSMTAV